MSVILTSTTPLRNPRSLPATAVHRGETQPEHGIRTFAVMTFHTTMTMNDRPPMKQTPAKATPIKLTPPRQTPVKPVRT